MHIYDDPFYKKLSKKDGLALYYNIHGYILISVNNKFIA